MHDADGNRIAEYDYDPGTQISTLLREYVWMNGENVAVVEGGVVYYVRTDHIGRPVFATDDSGTKIWEASYLPFGGVHTSTGSNSNLRFPGQWFQSEAGLHQNWMRDYDPTTGRYIQADPLGLFDGPSLYGYARQNPNRFIDPTGLSTEAATAAGAAAGVGAALVCTGPQVAGCLVVAACAGVAAAIIYMATGDTPDECEACGKEIDNEESEIEEAESDNEEIPELTDHAWDRMREKGMSAEEFFDTLRNPDNVREGTSDEGPTTVYEKDNKGVVVNEDGGVVTVWKN